jgi:uncharacterized membrane protein YgcG
MPPDFPNFLPSQAPTSPILDLSNSLDAVSIEALNHVAADVGYSPKVVVLPKQYDCPDARQLTLDLAQRWGVNGDGKTLLLVVDLKGHKVRAHGSPELNQAGVTSDYITNSLIPQQFVPYMRKGDLATAIRLTMLDVDKVQRQGSERSAAERQSLTYDPAADTARTAAYQASNTYRYPSGSVPVPAQSFPLIPIIGILAAGACAMIVGHRYIELSENKNLYADLQTRMDSLFSKTDKLAQAADFLDANTHTELCHKIADYFAKITTLQNAQAQVEALLKQGVRGNGRALRAITRCRQYVGSMELLATDLLRRVEVATGTKHSYEPNGNIEVTPTAVPSAASTATPIKTAIAQNNNGARISTSFRPRWTSEPAYARTVDADPLQTISTYVVEKERAAIPASFHSSHSSSGGGSWSSGSSWSSDSSSSSDGGGSWGSSSSSSDSSSGSSSDGGGSW